MSSRPTDRGGATSVSASVTIYLENLMRPKPPYTYFDKGCTIQFDFISWQEQHRHLSCFLTPTWCLMIPSLVENKYIIQVLNHQGTILYNNPKRWDRSIAVMVQKYPEPPRELVTLPPPGCHRAPPGPSQPTFPFPFVRHQDSLN